MPVFIMSMMLWRRPPRLLSDLDLGGRAQEILESKFGVSSTVFSATSYKALYEDARACERWNRLHPGAAAPRRPYVSQPLAVGPRGIGLIGGHRHALIRECGGDCGFLCRPGWC